MSRIYEALQKAESERSSAPLSTTPELEQPPRGYYARSAAAAALAEPESESDFHRNSVPESPAQPRQSFSPPASTMSPSLPGARLDLNAISTRSWHPDLAALPALQERGPAVEQFRSLRSRIYELRDIKPLRSVLISSGLPQEGKSFVAANLAISLARNRNSKVLLIDGDMRRYTLHKLLGCDPHPGLADYLAGRADLTDVMQRCAPSAGSESALPGLANLTLIPGGDGGDRASDLSASPRFAELLAEAGAVFDWIIVDSSPVLPVSDAVNLARSTDGVLLVTRSGVTDFTTAQQAQAQLKATHLLGVVLNAVEKVARVDSYYGYNARHEEAPAGAPQ